jgi:ATP-binding cassette subfamily C (CFTR/MRP) protein 4
LNTIADYDKVIVMDKGEIVEMGTPLELLTNSPGDRTITRSGIFAEMVLSTGDNADNIFNLARSKQMKGNNIPI